MTAGDPSRRLFLERAAAAGIALILPRTSSSVLYRDPWARAAALARRVVPPTFPDRDFDVTTFGAVADGERDASDALHAAIAACHAAGGGRVVVPAGTFLTGPIHLESRVNLHVAEGATLRFSRDPASYLPVVFTRWEGVELMNYSPLVYAFEQHDVAVTGGGTLDGQADDEHWWPWKKGGGPESQADARARLFEMAARGVPVRERVFGEGSFLRPSFIQPYRCQNVLVEGVKIVASPMWEIHPVLSTNVTVRNVTVVSHGPNNDGCDPESCRAVVIEGCSFDTGDDCIAIKSGRNDDGRRVSAACEDVLVRDCTMKDGHGGVVIGSEITGGARNVFVERCRMDSPRLDRALRIKTNSVRGGTVEGVYMRDVTVGEVAQAVVTINFLYEEGDAGQYTPTVRDVEVRNLRSRKSPHALFLRGYARAPIRDVRIVDSTFENVAGPDVIEGVEGLELVNVRRNGVLQNERITRLSAALPAYSTRNQSKSA
jgi:polygalacturonase